MEQQRPSYILKQAGVTNNNYWNRVSVVVRRGTIMPLPQRVPRRGSRISRKPSSIRPRRRKLVCRILLWSVRSLMKQSTRISRRDSIIGKSMYGLSLRDQWTRTREGSRGGRVLTGLCRHTLGMCLFLSILFEIVSKTQLLRAQASNASQWEFTQMQSWIVTKARIGWRSVKNQTHTLIPASLTNV